MSRIAFVIPSCGGKTTLAELYQLLDVDVSVCGGPVAPLVDLTRTLAIRGLLSWSVCNSIQWSYIESFISSIGLPHSVLLLHSREAAEFLRCDQIYNCVPTLRLHESCISARGQSSGLAQMNRKAILESCGGVAELAFDDFETLHRFVKDKAPVLDIINSSWLQRLEATHDFLHVFWASQGLEAAPTSV